jgi:hypothetical protein
MLSLVGLFVPVIKEMNEMLYQYESDYLFDSSDFENHFFKATPIGKSIEYTITALK